MSKPNYVKEKRNVTIPKSINSTKPEPEKCTSGLSKTVVRKSLKK